MISVNDGAGLVTTDLGTATRTFIGTQDITKAVLLQPDGKIILAGTTSGDIALARYTTSGTLDLSFGSGGVVSTPTTGGYSCTDAVLQQDGRILVVGAIYNGNGYNAQLVRYTSNGALDQTFGTGGIENTNLRSSGDSWLAVQADGKIIVGGVTIGSSGKPYAARFLPDGTLDLGFGIVGTVEIGIPELYGLAIDGSNRIIAYGSTGDDFAISRFTAIGAVDITFSGDGKLTTDLGGVELARAAAIQSDGKIVLAGNSNGQFSVVRYLSDGTLDPGFHATGSVITPMAPSNDVVQVAIQADGKIVVGGEQWTWANMAVVRYNKDGSLDRTFAKDGVLSFEFSTYRDDPADIILQPDGKILFAATSWGSDFAVARIKADGTLDTFGADLLPPTLSSASPQSGTPNVPINTDITLTFSESIRRGNGAIEIRKLDGSVVERLDASVSQGLEISGNRLKINPSSNLDYSSSYTIIVSSGAITDAAGNGFVSISSYDFMTAAKPKTQFGTPLNDRFLSTSTSETFDGQGGVDTVVFGKSRASYSLLNMQQATVVQEIGDVTGDTTDTLVSIERVKFEYNSSALDFTGQYHAAADVAKILGAVFGSDAVSNEVYSGIGLYYIDNGMSYESLCKLAIDATGKSSYGDVVDLLWRNVIGGEISAAEKVYFVTLLENGMSVGALTAMAADTIQNANNIDLVGLSQAGLNYVEYSG